MLGVRVTDSAYPVLDLGELGARAPFLTPSAAGFYEENAVVCLVHNGHRSGTPLQVAAGGESSGIDLRWSEERAGTLHRCYADLVKATEFGACAIALLLIHELTPFVAVEQAMRGTTVDYYLAESATDDTLVFNRSARLEVSGILAAAKGNTVAARLDSKRHRHKPESDLPTLVAIVEFGLPQATLEEI